MLELPERPERQEQSDPLARKEPPDRPALLDRKV